MTTTERILERLVKARFLLNNALAVLAGEKPKWALHYDDVVDAIASVIGKEMPKIDLSEVEKLILKQTGALYADSCLLHMKNNPDKEKDAEAIRSRIGYTLDDLTPKTALTEKHRAEVENPTDYDVNELQQFINEAGDTHVEVHAFQLEGTLDYINQLRTKNKLLREYAQHKSNCDMRRLPMSIGTCTCGLDQLLTTNPKEEKNDTRT